MSEMIKIPEGWEQIPLVKACDILMGQSPDGNTINQSEKGYPFLQGNAEFGKKYPSEKNWTTNPTRIAEKDSILLSVRAPVGELNIADKNYCIGRGLSSLTYKSYSLEYLYFAINHNKNQFRNLSQGSTFEAINRKNIEELSILSPKLEKEQQKIAEVLNEVDNAISKIEELFEKNKRLKTALMQDLLSYGIDENGKVRSPQTHTFKPSELGDIPVEWEIKKLKDIGEYKTGLTFSPDDVVPFNGTLVLRSTNIVDNKISLHDNVYVKKSLHIKYLLKEGDILICVRNGSRNLIGKNALITKKEENMAHGAFMSVFQTKLYSYVFHLFQSNLFFKQIEKNIGATINSINNCDLIEFIFPFPKSKTEQQKIAQILSSQDEKIEDIKNKLNKLKSLKASLMQDLLSGKVRVTKLMEENS